jgi:hypothetical protein
MDVASNALLPKGVQSLLLSPSRVAHALDRGGSTLRSKELPVCVGGSNSHYRPLKRQRAPLAHSPTSAVSSRLLRRKTMALFLFRTPSKPGPGRKKTWAAAPAPASPARRNALRAKKPLRRLSAGGAGGWCAPKAALLGHIYPIPSPTPRWVTGGPWRPPRAGLGPPRSKISGPWGLQAGLAPVALRRARPCGTATS